MVGFENTFHSEAAQVGCSLPWPTCRAPLQKEGKLKDKPRIGLPMYPHPSVLGGKNISFTPVPVIMDWNHSGCRHPKGYSTCMCKENMIG